MLYSGETIGDEIWAERKIMQSVSWHFTGNWECWLKLNPGVHCPATGKEKNWADAANGLVQTNVEPVIDAEKPETSLKNQNSCKNLYETCMVFMFPSSLLEILQ